MSSASEASRQLSACVSSQAALALTLFLSASEPTNRCTQQLALRVPVARWVASAFRKNKPCRDRSRRSYNNVMVGGGPAPVRAYIEELLPDVLEGKIDPGRVFDRMMSLDQVPDGYRAMNEREAIKVMVKP